MNSPFKYILAIVIVLLFAAVPRLTMAQNPPAGPHVKSTLEYYSSLISKRGWMSTITENELRAFRFKADYDSITVRITEKAEGGLGVFDVEMKKNENTRTRRFTFDSGHPNYSVNTRNAMAAFLLSHTITEDETNRGQSPYFGRFSLGYDRTHDTGDIFPEKNKGGYYAALFFEYAPARLTGPGSVPLRFGDHITMDLYAVADTNPERRNFINEHFLNFDIIFYGTHTYAASGESSRHTTHGFYMGMEYFRPGWKDNVLLWSHQLYRDYPHIQYYIWRVVGWGFNTSLRNSLGEWSANFMTGIGPSINSSLFAVGLSPEEEENRSELFQSLTGSKQNYYYSTAWTVSASAAAERIWRLRFAFGYSFYYFVSSDPAIDDHAFDLVHILKPSAGIYILDNLMASFNYEHWRIYSDLEGDKKSHAWNRLVLELRYIF